MDNERSVHYAVFKIGYYDQTLSGIFNVTRNRVGLGDILWFGINRRVRDIIPVRP